MYKKYTNEIGMPRWHTAKIWLMMRLTTVILIASLMQVSAASLAQRITLNQKKSTLEKIFRDIHKQTGYDFIYDKELLDQTKLISIVVKNEPLETVLKKCLENQSLDYLIEDKLIVIREKLKSIKKDEGQIQKTDIKGKITDLIGKGIPSVNISIKGTSKGTSSDSNGNFSLSLAAGENEIIISAVGFESQTIAVNNQTNFNIVLKESLSKLSEVVVVGYGTQKKSNLTGSVVTVDAKQIKDRGVANISNILAGQAPGVTVLQRGGPPGRDMGTINIRGIGTLGNANALLIVDGIQTTDLSQVNPNDIESVSVLKDAASSAIYGINAANGVIIVTTKRGIAGKLKVNYEMQGGFSDLGKVPQTVSSADLATMYNEAQTNDGIPTSGLKFTAQDIQKFRDGSSPLTHANTNWVDAVFPKSGNWLSHNLTFNGGNEDTKYNVSLGYLDQDGLMNNTGYQRYNFRTNFDQKISSWLSTGFNLALSLRNVNDPPTVSGVGGESWYLHQAFQQWPNDPVSYPDGRYAYPTWSSLNSNPVAYSSTINGYSKNADTRLIGSAFAEIKIIDGLKLKGVASNTRDYNYASNLGLGVDLYRINKTTGEISATPENAASIPALTTTRNVSRGFDRYSDLNLQLLLNYDKTFDKHGIKVLAGYEQRKITSESEGITRINLSDPSLTQINAADPLNQSTYGNTIDFRSRSAFGRLNYIYDEKYLFEANFRYDASSRFPAGKRAKLFPAFSAGWVLSKENFLNLPKAISMLKVRASWGQLGNQEIDNYRFLSTYEFNGQYIFDGNKVVGIREGALANNNITWETTTSKNLGLDLGLFNNKLTLTGEIFKRDTKDILLPLPQASILGAAPPTSNAGAVSNNGFEIIATYKDRVGEVGYYLNANIAQVTNKITDLKGTDVPGKRVGDPIYNLFGYQADGLFQNQAEINASANQSGVGSTPKPGDIKYKDINGDGFVNAQDQVNLGTFFPKINYGFSFGADYKGFDFSTVWQGVAQVKGILNGRLAQPFGSFGSAPIVQQLDHWTTDGTNANAAYPRLSFTAAANNVLSSYWLRNTAFLKLRNVQLGYSLPTALVNKIKLSRVRFYLSGENLLTISPFKIMDPESITGSDPFFAYGGSGAYPVTKRFLAGLSITY